MSPAGTETCNGVDQDCDGSIDEDATDMVYSYLDDDHDGYGDASVWVEQCDVPADYVANNGDCDDSESDIYPGGIEVCDGMDQDCDGTTDNNASDATTWFADIDEDGYGDPAVSALSCEAPTGWVTDGSGCDDTSGLVAPGAFEQCDGVDEDCDGVVDNDAVDGTWYTDADGDGYGDPATEVDSCTAPADAVATGGDCDDTDPDLSPGAAELCDGLDQDCDDTIDNGASCDCEQVNEGGHSYLFCEDAVTWWDAEVLCIEYGYQLASLDDAAENEWVVDTAYGWLVDECSEALSAGEQVDRASIGDVAVAPADRDVGPPIAVDVCVPNE